MTKKLKIIDLFCGVGGLSYGFAHRPEFEIVAANDNLPDMAAAYELNHPGVKVYCDDVKEFSAARLLKDTGVSAKEIDVIVGGPPCQSFSTAGKRLVDDPRAKLFQEYYRILDEFRPKLFIFENVRGLLSIQKGELLKTIIASFSSLGYDVQYKVLNAADYGAPQERKRVIIVGHLLNKDFKYPKKTHGKDDNLFDKPYVTLGEAIGDLPLIRAGEEASDYASLSQNEYQKSMRDAKELVDHNAPNNNPKLIALMEALPQGGTPKDVPETLRPKSGFGNSYCRLWWDRPSTTITRNLGTPSSARCIHPLAPRALTTREGARLQGFPDSYKFVGSRTSKNLQIGNAVPTQLAKALAGSVADFFKESELEVDRIDSNKRKHKTLVKS